MKIEGTYTLNASQQEVWDLFNDTTHLSNALPGCEELVEREPGKYDMVLKIGVAGVKGQYGGKMEVLDQEPPNRYRLVGEGSGSPGFVKGEALIEFSQKNDTTIISYQGDVQVGGLIAGIGQRMMGGIAKMMLRQFFKNMENELKTRG